MHHSGREYTYPQTTGGTLWPAGVSNPTVGNVTPTDITTTLSDGQSEHHTVSLTLPPAGSLTNMVDVFLLFDDTGSFTANSPIVRAAFPQIIATLQAALPGVDLGFGIGRFEEYANFALENPTGRPFILNQPIIAATTPGFAAAIQAALDRTAPGYGGDQPETDIEALYQMATGAGFDGNNNGTTTDSGAAGLVSSQLNPGASGDVPTFASFTVDPAGNVLPASGNIDGAGFRPGALPIILTATDTGFAFQPRGETSITGVGGLTLPVSAFTQLSRPTTPFNSGAGIQDTITALNALGALVIGLGTNGTATLDPRQALEALARLTGAVNQSAVTIPNGTLDPIAPGDPLYFLISSGFGASVANGIVTAIQNAVSTVSVNLTLKASDPRVQVVSAPGVVNGVGSGETATFDVTRTGDGRPHRPRHVHLARQPGVKHVASGHCEREREHGPGVAGGVLLRQPRGRRHRRPSCECAGFGGGETGTERRLRTHRPLRLHPRRPGQRPGSGGHAAEPQPVTGRAVRRRGRPRGDVAVLHRRGDPHFPRRLKRRAAARVGRGRA